MLFRSLLASLTEGAGLVEGESLPALAHRARSEAVRQRLGAEAVAELVFLGAPERPGREGLKLAIGGRLVLLGLGVVALTRRRSQQTQALALSTPPLTPGATVAEVEASLARAASGAQVSGATTVTATVGPAPAITDEKKALPDPDQELREKARQLIQTDPERAALLLKAWIDSDPVPAGAPSEVTHG